MILKADIDAMDLFVVTCRRLRESIHNSIHSRWFIPNSSPRERTEFYLPARNNKRTLMLYICCREDRRNTTVENELFKTARNETRKKRFTPRQDTSVFYDSSFIIFIITWFSSFAIYSEFYLTRRSFIMPNKKNASLISSTILPN